MGFHASLQATPTSTSDPLSLGPPEPVAAVTNSKPPTSKSSAFQDDDDLFSDPLLGSGGGKPPASSVPETKNKPSSPPPCMKGQTLGKNGKKIEGKQNKPRQKKRKLNFTLFCVCVYVCLFCLSRPCIETVKN